MKIDPKKIDILPYEITSEDIYALRALQKGQATDRQQERAFNWIISQACGAYNMSFHPTNTRSTDFNEGRRFVANTILSSINIDPLSVENLDKKNKDLQK